MSLFRLSPPFLNPRCDATAETNEGRVTVLANNHGHRSRASDRVRKNAIDTSFYIGANNLNSDACLELLNGEVPGTSRI